jgi:Flp pilus assembly protein TadB
VYGQRGEVVAMSLAISFFIAIFGVILLVLTARLGGKESGLVTAALLAEDVDDSSFSYGSDNLREGNGLTGSPFKERQLDTPAARRKAWIVGAACGVLVTVVFLKSSTVSLLVAIAVGALVGELYTSRRKEAFEKRQLRKMEFYLPTVMERIVMAVGTGLDIVPALREAAYKGRDPVSQLMHWIVSLSESGTPVESAFEMAAQQRVTPSVKHACIHLGLAYRQGGEIVRPLKELSDATQVAYQETIEEQIAKLPVKAVLPLVLTFTGLIVCFLTVPLMQVGSITKEVASVAKQ